MNGGDNGTWSVNFLVVDCDTEAALTGAVFTDGTVVFSANASGYITVTADSGLESVTGIVSAANHGPQMATVSDSQNGTTAPTVCLQPLSGPTGSYPGHTVPGAGW